MELNLRSLSRIAAAKIVDQQALGKALNTLSPGPQQQLDQRRKEELVKQIASTIEETLRPWSNEAFQ